jgi:hypothetical protein
LISIEGDLLLWMGWMSEAARWAEKPRGQRDQGTGYLGRGLAECPQEHGLDTTHVDQIESQSAAASLLQPMASVLLSQA